MISDAQKLEAFKARMGQRCRCGAKKPQGHPFCPACWQKLPSPLQYALTEHLTKNFNDRYFEAVDQLKALGDTTIHRVPTVFASGIQEIK